MKEREPPAWVDSRQVEWSECRCGGQVGIQGRVLVHDHPACEAFLQGLRDAGVELVKVKYVALS